MSARRLPCRGSPCVVAGRSGHGGVVQPRSDRSRGVRGLARVGRSVGAHRLRDPVRRWDGRFRSRHDLRPGRRRFVRTVMGQHLNLAGATLGATFAFLIARYIAGDWVARKAGGLLKRLVDGVEAEGWRFVAFVRLVPLFPFNLSTMSLGLTRIPLHQYVLATLGLHGAGSGRLYLARLRGAGGAGRRAECNPLRLACARPARRDCLAAATDPPPAPSAFMDRGC